MATPKPTKRVYPHVTAIEDWPTQQTARLIWDRLFDLEERLTTHDTRLDTLTTDAQTMNASLTEAQRKADEALANAQITRPEAAAAGGSGVSTIPDYGDIVANVLATKFVSPTYTILATDDARQKSDDAKGQLTRAAAWEIFSTVDPTMRLLAKTGGANSNGRASDIIVQGTDGSYADTASVSDTVGDPLTFTVHASWGAAAPDSNTSDSSRWIVPTAAIAAEPGPLTPV